MDENKKPIIGVGTLNLSAKAKEMVMETLDRNRLSYGPYSEGLETQFAKIHGTRFGILSNSGTSSLHVSLAAMKEIHGWEDDTEVIVPALTFVATSNIVLHTRMNPVFVDVESNYYELDPTRLEASITSKTRAIIPVHLFGQPADMDPIREIAKRHNLRIIEDSCETMFARYNGTYVGGLGDIGCFSTYVAHLLVTGVGGISLTNDPEYAVKMRSLVNHGRDSIYISIDDDDDLSKEELRMMIGRRFFFESVGHSFRVTEMEAALGLAQLETWEDMIAKRRANAHFLTRELARFEERMQLPSIRPGSEHSFMMYPLVLRGEPKTEIANFLEQRGIETRDMLPITNQPVYRTILGLREEDYPVAKWVNESGFYIGCHQDLKQSDLDYVVEIFERYWRLQRRQIRTEEAVTFVLIANSSWNVAEHALEAMPWEMFDSVMLVNVGAASDELEKLAQSRSWKFIQLNRRDVIGAILAHEIVIETENVLIFPADGRHDVYDIPRLLFQLERGNDMVIASRFLQGGGRKASEQAQSLLRSTGNRFFTLLANVLFYGNISDSISEFRAFRASRAKNIRPAKQSYTTLFTLSIQAIRQGWRIGEEPTIEYVANDNREQWQAWMSILPLLGVLWTEWWSQWGQRGK
jgi:dTDP-4-amino-4,6-dideoxygalactose transaminase